MHRRRPELGLAAASLLGRLGATLVIAASSEGGRCASARALCPSCTSPDRPLRETAQKKVLKYQNAYANDHSITFMQAIASTTGRLHAEFLRLLFWHAHRESEEFSKLTGQLAQPNQDSVFSKRAAFFNSLKSKVGHIMAKASALRVNMNLAPTVPSTSRARTSSSHTGVRLLGQ